MLKCRTLRSPEGEQGTAGATTQKADEPDTKESGTEAPKSINSQAKELPWVREALAAKAELDRLKAEQAEAQQTSERKKAEAKHEYEKALEMEKKRVSEIEARHQGELRRMKLEAAFLQAGAPDMRAAKLFEADYDPEKEKIEEFVSRIKADESNSWLFPTTKTRTPASPPPAGGFGGGEDYDPSWIRSDDPKKREIAITKNRSKFWADFHAKQGGTPK